MDFAVEGRGGVDDNVESTAVDAVDKMVTCNSIHPTSEEGSCRVEIAGENDFLIIFLINVSQQFD